MTDIASTIGEPLLAPIPSLPIAKRHLLSAVVGNALEFYDFVTYTYFAGQIGQCFFPSHTPIGSLLLSLATFGVGFATRPIGGIVIGAYADRVGRSPAMVLSFVLMGIGILILTLTPPYAAIGVAAPILVVFARLLQGFALGGQVGPSTAFLLETASPKSRGFYTTLQYASQGLASMVAGIVAVIISSNLDASSLQQWGWRLTMILGALVLPFGLVIRKTMPETLEQADSRAASETLPAPKSTGHIRVFVLGLVMLASATIGSYIINYMAIYASAFLHMRANVSFAAPVVSGACILLFSLLGGWMSDKYGRKTVMIWPRVFLLFAIYPAFVLLAHNRDALTLLGVTAAIAILASWSSAASLVNIAESMPRDMRSGALGTVYAVAIAVFGGTTQYVVTWLIGATGHVLAPAWYLTGATFIGLIAMMMSQETAPVKLEKI
ncbi:MAG: MFS transporter [Rhizomicrobium sp.]|jgi:MFS family permease